MVGCQNPQNNQSEQSYKSSSTTSNEKVITKALVQIKLTI
jgi:hypothetical protein